MGCVMLSIQPQCEPRCSGFVLRNIFSSFLLSILKVTLAARSLFVLKLSEMCALSFVLCAMEQSVLNRGEYSPCWSCYVSVLWLLPEPSPEAFFVMQQVLKHEPDPCHVPQFLVFSSLFISSQLSGSWHPELNFYQGSGQRQSIQTTSLTDKICLLEIPLGLIFFQILQWKKLMNCHYKVQMRIDLPPKNFSMLSG